MKKNSEKKIFSYARLLLLLTALAFASLFYARKTNFCTSDLGRHIKNGELIISNKEVINTNYYSFTQPGHPTNMHHWGSGILFYLVFLTGGFKGLSIFNILIHTLALWVFFIIARKKSGWIFAFSCLLLSIPLISSRVEIRPEAFSYLLFALIWLRLSTYNSSKHSFRTLLIIPVLQLIWVNLHIFFIFGLFLTASYFAAALIRRYEYREIKNLGIILLLSTIISMASPNGFSAFLEPFNIFREYAYTIAENQSLFFMQGRFPQILHYYWFEGLLLAAVLSWIPVFIHRQQKYCIAGLFIFIAFSLLGIVMVRMIAFWGFIMIPLLAQNIYITTGLAKKNTRKVLAAMPALITIGIILMYVFNISLYRPPKNISGLGLMPSSNSSAEFFRQAHLKGPIFNNYDIGSYLIFHLYPDHRVFTDNRPEAYSTDFFKDIYIPMQEDEGSWEKYCREYNINCIWFYRHDMTPWAQPFLLRRVRDKKWAAVFVDPYTIIFLRRQASNKAIIDALEIPEEMFVEVDNSH